MEKTVIELFAGVVGLRVGLDNINTLSIQNFNNYPKEDIDSLTQEILESADNFIKRKGVAFGI